MGNMQARLEIKEASKQRMKLISFGNLVTNICAGEKNPMRYCYFVQNKNDCVRCTDKKGKFFDININVIYPGHLSANECEKLFQPVWQAEYGDA